MTNFGVSNGKSRYRACNPAETDLQFGGAEKMVNDMVELIKLAQDGVINPIVSKHYSLDDANQALEDLKNRKIIGRAVINP